MLRNRRGAGFGQVLAAILLLMVMLGTPLGRGADARGAPIGARMGPAIADNGEPGNETERWWGVAGAVLCGVEIRLVIRVPAIGMNPYAIAAGIAGCSLAMLDVITSK